MAKVKVKISGKTRSYDKGVSIKDIANDLKKQGIIAATLNDKLVDISVKVNKDSEIELIDFNSHEGKDVFHHSSAHVLAQAVLRVFPKAKLTIGPTVEGGFYYDVDVRPLNPEDLEKIETEMKKIVDEKLEIKKHIISKEKALKLFKDNPYKKELIKELPAGEKISYYEQGEFKDLCRGPHVPHTRMIKSFKLTKISAAYWKGDSKNKSLQRIYGVSFPDRKMLREFIRLQEEAKKRDHRIIGKELDLFSFHEEGAGFPFWHDKGMIIWDGVMGYMKDLLRSKEYQEISTPIILNKDLWLKSGHWDHYKESMYFTTIDKVEHAVKPMNCPGGLLVYKNNVHSYRELPIKAGEFGLVHRHEMSGVLAGLFRVRSFTQDDAHVFCTEKQLKDEIKKLIELIIEVYSAFGFKDYQLELSTRPEGSIGSDKMWDNAEKSLSDALKDLKLDYQLNPGDGAFYGPKIDFHIKDCMNRSWQCGTIQVDFSMPERLELTYEGKDGKKHRPVMIHRAILGSFERFIGILIEHYAGRLPLWLSPVQVKVLTVSDNFNKYAEEVVDELGKVGVRVELDEKSESISKKVRTAQHQKVNYVIVIGEKEEKNKTLAIRKGNDVEMGVKLSTFLKRLLKEINDKK
ncbi:threonine--tRNA ligase [Candidatus Woesearchaeota archaeon]|nr:threonine--tRNA ligase [Candidatus Woesearchaeota archaeon]